jgi:hypothetical protein
MGREAWERNIEVPPVTLIRGGIMARNRDQPPYKLGRVAVFSKHDQDSGPAFGFMLAPRESDWYSACSARSAHRSAIESSMARISGLVVARIASRQWAAFCFQGVRMGQA